MSRAQALTCGNSHAYTAEQQAFHGGLMDKFVEFTSCAGSPTAMGYYDGNTVTALWNYAQYYTLSDAYFSSVFGPSLPGHLNLISGQTHGATPDISGQVVGGTVISGPHAAGDECGNRNPPADISFGAAPNIGTLLSAKGVSWGWFMGGFRPTGSDAGGAVCGAAHANVGGAMVRDYVPHHKPFQYYDETRNPTHKPPATAADIGHDDPGRRRPEGTSPVRPRGLPDGTERRQRPRGVLPQAARLPGRPRRLLEPARRAALPGRDDQRDPELLDLARHGDRDRL